MTPAHRLACRWLTRVSATTPLPDKFETTEPGLLTWAEFLTLRNPKGESHEAESYDWDLQQMNKDHSLRHLGQTGMLGEGLGVWGNREGILLKEKEQVIGVIHRGTLYHDKWSGSKFPESYLSNLAVVYFEVKRRKVVKYITEAAALVSNIARNNLAANPVLLQNILVQGEPCQVRAEGTLKKGERASIVVLNSGGLKVASAQDEWGATLLVVAQEYRGRGLGQIIGKLWYRWNPHTPSGGFTPRGQANALRLWADRVRQFLSNGWYSELVRAGRLPMAKVKEILAGLPGKKPRAVVVEEKKVTSKMLVLVDHPVFAVYDQAFLDDPDDQYIYAYGFFRDSLGKSFLYTIDYDRGHDKLATAIALQMARDDGKPIYVGEGYGDTLEWNLIRQAEADASGDYVALTGDILNLPQIARLEKGVRRKRDPYGDKYSALLEMAESKWG